MKRVYLNSKLLFKQVLLKTIEHRLFIISNFFQISLLFFSCQDLDSKGIDPYLLTNFCQLKTTLPLMTIKIMVISAWKKIWDNSFTMSSSSSYRAGSTDIPDLSRHSSLSFIALGRSSGQQPVSSHSC